MDMHIHTNYSDGFYNVNEIVSKLKESNIKTFAITDHDNILSINDLINCDMEWYNGIEITARTGIFDIHLLGYGFDSNNQGIIELCNFIRINRNERIKKTIEILIETKGITFNDNDLNELYNRKTALGKVHIIDLMNKYGYGSTNREIYNKYLKDIKNLVTDYRVDSKIAIDTIKNANGVVVLAHPKDFENEYKLDAKDIIPWLKYQGLEGIEVYNSLHNQNDTIRYIELANKYDLLISGGSDYHGGLAKPDVNLGHVTKEGLKIKQLTLVDHLRNR